MPATWEGIDAVRSLEAGGIRCNCTLVFSLPQARFSTIRTPPARPPAAHAPSTPPSFGHSVGPPAAPTNAPAAPASSPRQAVACAEAGASVVSPSVGRVSEWFASHDGRGGQPYPPEEDPGVRALTAIYDHLKDPTTGLGRTEIMAASLRNAGQARRRRCAVRDAGCCCCADNGGGNAARIE